MPRAFVLTCALLVVIAALIIYGWSRKPPLLRSAVWILPCFLFLYAVWGYPGEIRVMLEVYPIVGLLMVPPQPLEASNRLKAVKALRS